MQKQIVFHRRFMCLIWIATKQFVMLQVQVDTQELVRPPLTLSDASPAPTKWNSPHATHNPSVRSADAGSSNPSCKAIGTSTLGTTTVTTQLDVVPPPPEDASDTDRMAYVNYQLDTLRGADVLGGLVLQEGPRSRARGGTKPQTPTSSAVLELLKLS